MEVRMTKFEVVMMMWEVRLANLNQQPWRVIREPKGLRRYNFEMNAEWRTGTIANSELN